MTQIVELERTEWADVTPDIQLPPDAYSALLWAVYSTELAKFGDVSNGLPLAPIEPYPTLTAYLLRAWSIVCAIGYWFVAPRQFSWPWEASIIVGLQQSQKRSSGDSGIDRHRRLVERGVDAHPLVDHREPHPVGGAQDLGSTPQFIGDQRSRQIGIESEANDAA